MLDFHAKRQSRRWAAHFRSMPIGDPGMSIAAVRKASCCAAAAMRIMRSPASDQEPLPLRSAVVPAQL
jgi:hypothetical protein